MEIKKASQDTFDVYTAKLSYLELKTLADALRAGGEGAVADELRRSFEWHVDRLPGPGEDSKKKKDEDARGSDDEIDKKIDDADPEADISPEIKPEVDDMLPPPPAE
jgi:hypothetical protein